MKNLFLSVFVVVAAALFGITTTQADEGKKNMNANAPVVLINPFTVPKDKLDDAIKSWETGRNFLSQQPGYISTKLHQSLSPDAQYLLINVAEWETPEAFKAATTAMRAKAKFPPIEGVVPAPALYSVIRD
ncbi:MAG: antibiotic biosynthesis monooxygenase [Alphaproteobacteria bacterium]|nr:antibiotic biosynthesis monooxygenase [Alphaproteobacteria bacterium]